MTIVKLENIVKRYGKQIILDKFNLEVDRSEMIAIMGESGSGKSTVLNIIGLLETFDEGAYSLFNQVNIKPNSKDAINMLRKHVSYLFQNFALIEDDSILNNLLIGLEFSVYSKKEKLGQIHKVLEKVGLQHDIKTKVSSLSGGEQQRLAIARIILKDGDIILADEPTGSLDDYNKEVVMSLIEELHDKGKTVIIVTHDKSIANRCQRIICL